MTCPVFVPKCRAALAIYASGIAGSVIYTINEKVVTKKKWDLTDRVLRFATKLPFAYANPALTMFALSMQVYEGMFEGIFRGVVWPLHILAVPGCLYNMIKDSDAHVNRK